MVRSRGAGGGEVAFGGSRLRVPALDQRGHGVHHERGRHEVGEAGDHGAAVAAVVLDPGVDVLRRGAQPARLRGSGAAERGGRARSPARPGHRRAAEGRSGPGQHLGGTEALPVVALADWWANLASVQFGCDGPIAPALHV